MSFKIPPMQYDKKINVKKAADLLNFTEKYIKSFQDNMAENTYERTISTRFFGRGPFEILMKRRVNFNDDEINDPEFFYIQKYKSVILRLITSIEASNFTNPYKLDLSKLANLLDFFEHQGYLTKKQIKLIHFLLKDYPRNKSISQSCIGKINTVLHHHIKKDFMKVETAPELAEIISKIGEKKVTPKKKMIFSLTQIRNELSS